MRIENLIAPDNGAVPTETKLIEGAALKAALATSKLRLFKAGTAAMTALLTKDLLDANECDFDGYTAGGVTVAAFGDPYVGDDGSSVLLTAPSKQFDWAHVADDVANEVGGAYLVDADGNLRGAVEFEEAVTMGGASDSLVVLFTRRV